MEQRKGEDGEWLYMYIEHAKNVNPDQTTSNIVNSSLEWWKSNLFLTILIKMEFCQT